MGLKAIIRQGDRTSHGGTVIEGSQFDICMGKPIAFIGHKTTCPKCKGTYPIVEGAGTTSFYGKGVALEGMKTACGAALIAGQFTDTVECGSGNSSANNSVTTGKQNSAGIGSGAFATASSLTSAASGAKSTNPLEQYDEQPHLRSAIIEGIAYVIETADGRTVTGRTGSDGMLPRIDTLEAGEYAVYWGDEALAKIDGAMA